MRKFIYKLFCVGFVLTFSFGIYSYQSLAFDTFNVFHWKNIRFTSAEPNKNFIKTKYILANPKKFDAFIFGSSRVNNIPANFLPKEFHWYNMTHSEGIPAEHIATLNTFSNADIDIKMILVAFDNIAMYASVQDHENQLLRMPYQVYERNPLSFYIPYLKNKTDCSIINEIKKYDSTLYIETADEFYNYGGCLRGDFSLTENPNMESFLSGHGGQNYSQKKAPNDIVEITNYCKEHKIKLFLITNPIYETTYKDAVDHGYFDLLHAVAQNCEFYNFSTLNNYTRNPAYYYESSHYRPALGLLVEKLLFGSEDEKSQIRKDADDEFWGIKVNAENIEQVISHLKAQLGE